MKLIKLCGFKTSCRAFMAAKSGADFIGIVNCVHSCRYVEKKQARDIACASRKGGAKPVLVFDDHNVHDMLELIKYTKSSVIQLHGDISRSSHVHLPKDIIRIFSIPINKDGSIPKTVVNQMSSLDNQRDYLLFDSIDPGSGQLVNYGCIEKVYGRFKFFIAGGLSCSNVSGLIKSYNPFGVDVSSGIEHVRGEKSMDLILKMIEKVKGKCYVSN